MSATATEAVVKVFGRIQTHGKDLENVSSGNDQVISDMTPNRDVAWQGDVGIVYCGPDKPKNWKPVEVKGDEFQVAVGTGIGARHTVDTREVSLFEIESPTPLDGNGLYGKKNWTLSHPEHGNIKFDYEGYYRVVYQRRLADELARQMD